MGCPDKDGSIRLGHCISSGTVEDMGDTGRTASRGDREDLASLWRDRHGRNVIAKERGHLSRPRAAGDHYPVTQDLSG